ncbi:MAG: tRNA (guanosine(46)-N7)-methyltransferase TrmB [Candidatus Kapaibacterium sp.]|jgi:tRNA (guanine-N(7)-)-methyltransferase
MNIDPLRYPQPRSRHHTNPQFYLPLRELHVVPSQYPPAPQSIDWSLCFADGLAPSALDIGCGWGNFLLEIAERRPHINVLGIELRKNAVDWINSVIDGEHVPNARALYYSVANDLPFIQSGSISEVYYFFPDPWFKKRHSKRRAFTAEFLTEVHRVLAPGGHMYLMTDVPDVDEYQCAVLAEHGGFTVEQIHTDSDWLPVRTDHENYCLRRGFAYTRRRCTAV